MKNRGILSVQLNGKKYDVPFRLGSKGKEVFSSEQGDSTWWKAVYEIMRQVGDDVPTTKVNGIYRVK